MEGGSDGASCYGGAVGFYAQQSEPQHDAMCSGISSRIHDSLAGFSVTDAFLPSLSEPVAFSP